MATPLVSVSSLFKDFKRPNGSLFTVLEGINLDIYDNEFVAIVGLSGSGKSTLLRCMAGLMKPDRGQVIYPASLPEANFRRCSFVFQNFALLPWLTVRENIEIAIRNITDEEKKQAKIDKMLEVVGLSGFEDAYPRELSGGMKQRVGICRAMIGNPMVLFMDEPFGALDPLTCESLRSEIGQMWSFPQRSIRAIVLVTHSLEDAIQLADRVFILSSNPGQIFRTIDIPLARPRVANTKEYQHIQDIIERALVDSHLGKLDAVLEPKNPVVLPTTTAATMATTRRLMVPLVSTNLANIEGLLFHLDSLGEQVDLYDVCDSMGESLNQIMPVVLMAEIFGLVTTPGIKLQMTEMGKDLIHETEMSRKQAVLKRACLNHPLIRQIYEAVKKHEDGLEKEIVMEQIMLLLPFENSELQFEEILRWSRYAVLMNLDESKTCLVLEEEMAG